MQRSSLMNEIARIKKLMLSETNYRDEVLEQANKLISNIPSKDSKRYEKIKIIGYMITINTKAGRPQRDAARALKKLQNEFPELNSYCTKVEGVLGAI